MTEQFIKQCGLNESVATAKTYQYIDIIESAFDAMKDGIPNFTIVHTSGSYTQSLIMDLLENVKAILLQLCQRVLSALNNLQVNNVRLIQRYQEVLLTRMKTLKEPIVHKTHAYPDLGEFPAVINATKFEREIVRLQQEISDPNSTPSVSRITSQVDGILRDFTKQVIGHPVNVQTLKSSVENEVRKRVRGKVITTEVTETTLVAYMEQINRYKQDKADITRLKKSVNEEYQRIKDMYASVTEDPIALAKNTVRYNLNPEKEEFLANEYGRYADIHVEMLRLFNGFITVYNTAFTTVLNVLEEKIEDRKNFITTLFSTTGIFAALNTKNVGTYTNPISYMPPKV
ncbi:MAG: hypothetical protein NC489_07995 [Ruminococcus flavefaciens]|nr:hypothetical protein [Ruminococcus flavefaciens]